MNGNRGTGEVAGMQSNVWLWLNWQDNSVDQKFNWVIQSNSLPSFPYGLYLIMIHTFQPPTGDHYFPCTYHSLSPLSSFLFFETFTRNPIHLRGSANAEIFSALKATTDILLLQNSFWKAFYLFIGPICHFFTMQNKYNKFS